MSRLGFKQLILVIFGLVTLAWAVWINPDGYIANDEAFYHMMTLSLGQHGNLFVWNGYEEFPSPELIPALARAHNGHLYPQFPALYSIIAYPFVVLLGFKGFYLLNSISLLATVGICYRWAKSLFRDVDLAVNACLILLFATYIWEYGQSAWPHGVSVFLITLSAYLAIVAYRSSRLRMSCAAALGAGLVAGLGVGVRLDTILVLPAIALPFLFARPWRPFDAIAIGVGAIPGLGILAFSNYLKFGVFSPLSYGPVPTEQVVLASYLPIIVLGLGILMVAWLATRQNPPIRPGTRPIVLVGGLALLVGAGFAFPDVAVHGARLANGAYTLLVDLSSSKRQTLAMDVAPGPGGVLMLHGAVAKAFLQACPYFFALAIPVAAFIRGSEDRGELAMLFLVPAIFVTFYSYFLVYGVSPLTLRYYLPALPFTSILCAYAWSKLNRGLSNRWSLPQLTVVAATAIIFTALMAISQKSGDDPDSIAVQEIMFRAIPLVMFALGLGLSLVVVISGERAWQGFRGLSSLLLIGAIAWSGMSAFQNDNLRSYLLRNKRADLNEPLAQALKPDSVIFADTQVIFYRLWVEHRVRVAVPWYDDFGDFHALRKFHAERGRATYLWLNEGMQAAIREYRLLEGLESVPVFDYPGRGKVVQVIEPARQPSSATD